jgi:hypothetical protein
LTDPIRDEPRSGDVTPVSTAARDRGRRFSPQLHPLREKARKTMQKQLLALAVACAAVVTGVGTARADASVVHVNAANAWVTSGFWAEPGHTYAVTAVGRLYTTMPNGIFPPLPGIGRQGESGPEGQIYICTTGPGFECALDGVPFGQLIGRVGGVAFSIGAASSFTVPTNISAGYLLLAVNDYLGYYADNSGGYTVSIDNSN